MKLLTEVSLPEYPFSLNHRSQVLMMGSCFTENIGRLLERYLFPVSINPFGVTYNPLSVKKGLEALLHKDAYQAEDLERYNGLWLSFDHDTSFSSTERDKCLLNINRSFQEAKEQLKQARILILTWGTSWVYRYRASGEVVCNCHKIPEREFTRSRLTPREIITAYESLLPGLFAFNKQLKILHTVSPVRHWKDGAHGNQLSKASLLLAGDALQEEFSGQFFYFPSYEIVMDELRDYRFYARDMLHTSEQATRYIWEKFRDALIEEESREIIGEVEALRKMQEHRPLNEEGDAERQRLDRMEEKLEAARRKYPGLDWESFGKFSQ
jgi:hypothetical protein